MSGNVNVRDVTIRHVSDSANTQTVTSAEAQVGNAWEGTFSKTAELGFTRVLTTLTATDTTKDGLGGTFVFEFSDDGVVNNGISETRTITDFQTVRDFDLLNAGKYYRCTFEPSRALASDSVFVTTTLRRGFDGAFVRLGNQEIEEQNAALPQTFSYVKGFRTGGRSIGWTMTRGGAGLIAPIGVEIARGNVSGVVGVNKFGRNPDVDTGSTPEDIWLGGGVYTGFPTGTPEAVEVFSSSANDTSAGTGARTIRITGLATSASTAYTTEDITMSGTTPVDSSGTWYRVNRVQVLTAGSGQTNAGQITVRHTTTTANVFAQIAAGSGQSALCVYTVPAATTLFITDVLITFALSGGANGSTNVVIQGRPLNSSAWRNRRDYEITNSTSISAHYDIPLQFDAGTDIRFRAQSVSANNSVVSAEFSGALYDA